MRKLADHEGMSLQAVFSVVTAPGPALDSVMTASVTDSDMEVEDR